jgi:putative DNA primase/helicase
MANIGIATGAASSFWVIDIDVKSVNGWDSLFQKWESEIKSTAFGLCQKTTSGGNHVLVQWEEDYQPTNKIGVLPGVDIRADGGYIVAAPSTIGNKPYYWNKESLEPCEWNEWIAEIYKLSHQKKGHSEKDGNSPFIELEAIYQQGIPEGERDDTLFSIAAKLRTMDIPYSVAQFIMQRMGERCEPFDSEVKEKVLTKLDGAYERYRPHTVEDRRQYAQAKRKEKDRAELKSMQQEIARLQRESQ